MILDTQHTPGPWRQGRLRDRDEGVFGPDNKPIARCQRWMAGAEGDTWPDENRANARLIASAPEMKDALSTGIEKAALVVACWSSGDLAGAVNALEKWVDGAKALLAKVAGAAEPTKAAPGVDMVCATCGSDEVRKGADVVWSVGTQAWDEIAAVYDDATCEQCGGECKIEEALIEGAAS